MAPVLQSRPIFQGMGSVIDPAPAGAGDPVVAKLSVSRLFAALARLNQIGAALNQQGTEDFASLERTLQLIVESATEVVPGSSATIYPFDNTSGSFDLSLRVSTDPEAGPDVNDIPRAEGMGHRAAATRRRVLSYEIPQISLHPAKTATGAQVVVCYPLIAAEETLGVLYVYLHEPRRFDDLELLLLENFVNLTAITLSAVRRYTLAQQEQARKEKELRRLRRAGMLISSRSSLRETLEIILRMALEVTEARYGIFRLVDSSGENLVSHAFAGEREGRPAVETLPIDERSVMGWVAQRREPLLIDDLLDEPWRQIYYPLDHEIEMRSELAVPLIGAGGRLEGVLNLESPQVGAFSKQDRYILQIMANHAVTAIQEVRLLDVLQEISELLLTQTYPQVHQALVERACNLLNVPTSLIWLVEANELVLRASSDPALVGRRLPLGSYLTGQAVYTGATVIAYETRRVPNQVSQEPDFIPPFDSALIVPLYGRDRLSGGETPIGAFGVYSAVNAPRDFEQAEWDKKVLGILGQYAALAIKNTMHQEALRTAQEQRALAETFAAVGDIASNLLHRLNNIIGTIPVRVEGIEDKSRTALDADSYLALNLAEIEHSANEAMEVVRDSLFHLRPIRFERVCLDDCVAEALAKAVLRPEIKVQTGGLGDLPCVHAGPRRLVLVFVNLLENAADAMKDGGEIRIEGRQRNGWVDVRVSDTGPGIAEEFHERIFEFDYSTRKTERPGKLGFGLWWVKTLMVRFGGMVTVESDGKAGTTFTLSLPVAAEEGG